MLEMLRRFEEEARSDEDDESDEDLAAKLEGVDLGEPPLALYQPQLLKKPR